MNSREIVAHTSLRGVAALSVVVYHCTLAFPADGAFDPGRPFFSNAYLFVDLFFILSGFILYRNYHSIFERGVSVESSRAFYAKRIKRIYPTYLLWLLLAVAGEFAIQLKDTGTLRMSSDAVYSFVLHLAMVQSIFEAPILFNVPLWSIAVEMISYAAFPALVFVFARVERARLVLACASATGLAAIYFTHGTLDIIEGTVAVWRGVFGFVIGMFTATQTAVVTRTSTRTLSIVQTTALVAVIFFVTMSLSLAAVASFVVLVVFTAENRGVAAQVGRWRASNYLGVVSYSLYLAHAPIITLYLATMGFAQDRTGLPFISSFSLGSVCVVALSIVAAIASHRAIDAATRWFERRKLGTA